MSRRTTLGEDYFRSVYAANPDPWKFAQSEYERAKYDATIASLGSRRYESGLEVGCSIGVLTGRLALQVRRLTAIDIADQPLSAARARNQAFGNITFLKAAFPHQAPPGAFDLIVLSEVLYYLSQQDLERACDATLERLTAGGDMVLVHWLGETDYPLTGDEAAEGFIRRAGPALTTIQRTRHERYRLDVLRKAID
jgi:2-polyprenyl-3-methyl-5-hydroxy-6-metoxy-1,4-benzoquinol methylase